MSFINPATVYYVLAAATIVGGVLVRWLAARDKDQEDRFNERLLLITTVHGRAETTSNSRLDGLHAETKSMAFRLANVEREYITRADHAEFRGELLIAVKDIGAQVAHSLDSFRASMDKMMDRVNEVERQAAKR